MIEEIDSATYNKHYFEKVGGSALQAAYCAKLQCIDNCLLCQCLASQPNCTCLPAAFSTMAFLSQPQVFHEVGSDPEAFLAAALDFVRQESGFFSQPGAAAAVQRLADRCLQRGAAGAQPGTAAPPTAAPAAAAEQQQQQAPPPVAASEQPAPPQQPEAAPQDGTEAAAGPEEAGPSTLRESQGWRSTPLLPDVPTLQRPAYPCQCSSCTGGQATPSTLCTPSPSAAPCCGPPLPCCAAARRAQCRQWRRSSRLFLDSDAGGGGAQRAGATWHQGAWLRRSHWPRHAARGPEGAAPCAG